MWVYLPRPPDAFAHLSIIAIGKVETIEILELEEEIAKSEGKAKNFKQ